MLPGRVPESLLPKPVAISVILTSPGDKDCSSTTAPKMIKASGSTRSYIISAAWFTSNRVRSDPPVMFQTMPVARSMPTSRRGDEIALIAASLARDLPEASPIPMREEPASAITARTSAKSTFTSPGTVMMSQMPRTPWRRMSSAMLNASPTGVFLPTADSRRSLGMTMSVSTLLLRLLIASVACDTRRRPSKLNGVVTMPTVRIPMDLAMLAITGAAPLPVPPPIPAVTNTMSEPRTTASIASLLSSAARCPISGFPPAPRPRVSCAPICSCRSGGMVDVASACASVFTIQNSTPSNCASIMRLTALEPPPPVPITLMVALLKLGRL
mmetsp:Transcript_33565/g.64280  ORF Transcript_33565/g.64280 Transcript_33565/m.64280 type:complete len:328 (-) Transcript_33565:293-1276(-)